MCRCYYVTIGNLFDYIIGWSCNSIVNKNYSSNTALVCCISVHEI